MMGLPMPELFRGENENAQTVVLNLQYKGRPKLALALAPSTQRRNSFDLVFDLGCQMAFLRPERLLRFAFGTPAAIELGLRAALALGATAPPRTTSRRERRGRPADRVPAARRAAARSSPRWRRPGARWPRRAAKTSTSRSWLAATHLSAARTALVLTGDLGAAARVIISEPMPLTPISVQKRLLDLVAFSVSDDYFACRKQLGLHGRPDHAHARPPTSTPASAGTPAAG